MIRALVLTHGRLGEELRRVAELLLGPIEKLDVASNVGLAADRVVENVGRWLAEAPEEAVILVDERSGSCATAARIAAAGRKDVRIVCGVNLAMLLGYVTWRESQEPASLARRLVNAGREAIVELGTDS
jgi:mannose/fructose-specific phosphotransferase system component IIA